MNSEQYEANSEHYGQLMDIAAPVREKRRIKKQLVTLTIQRLCSGRYLKLRTLAELLDREPDSIRNHYVNPMLRDGMLRPQYPDHPNHPQQAYTTVGKVE